jgi:hypothetical protein
MKERDKQARYKIRDTYNEWIVHYTGPFSAALKIRKCVDCYMFMANTNTICFLHRNRRQIQTYTIFKDDTDK